ncbi:MAG: ABC transporter substrate-binding protein [Comamonadaceae bacterium]|nr:MAG: ABC transporter substrate-binding protein [Comamonadaceae bacterium]
MTLNPGCSRRDALRVAATGTAWLAAPALRAHTPLATPSGVLQIVGPWEIGGLAPARSGHVFTRMQIVETLMNAHDDGTPQPGLAARWELSADALLWRFHLRPTARFHDGTPVLANAVLRCLNAARVAPALLSAAPIAAIDADGPHTVRIRLSAPYGGLPALLAHSSTLVLAPSSYDTQGRVRAIVGSGPYRIARLAAPQQVEAEAFTDYDGPRPAIQQVRYVAAGRSETRALMAEGGQADLAYGLDAASLARLRRRPQLRVETVTLPRTIMLKLNAGLPALQDVRVRRALSLAIDRAGIAKALLRDPALAATQLLPPTLPAWHSATLAPLRHDPAAAQALLAQAGWQRGADGLRDARGQALTLSLRTFPDRPELPLVATALQEQFRQAGIAVQVNVGNSGEIPLGHRDGTLQLGLAARNYASVPDPVGTLLQDFGPQGGDWGAMGWHSDAAVAALRELARGGATSERSAALRAQVLAVLQDELPIIPIAWYRQQVAASPRVQGVTLDPLERSYRLTDLRWKA